MKKLLIISAKLAISIALISFAFSKIDTTSAFRLMGQIPVAAVAGLIGTLVVQQLLASIRLRRLLALLSCDVGLGTAIDAVFVGIFFSQTLISFIGGDAMRIWRITNHGAVLGIATRAVLLDRVAGFASLVGLIILGLPFLFGIVNDNALRAGIVAAIVLGLTTMLAFLSMSRLPNATRKWRVVRLVADVASQALAIARTPKEMILLLGLSLAIQVMNVIAIYVVSLGLGINGNPLNYLLLVPPVLLLAMLPISFAGWGVREGAMVVALGLVGVTAEQSVAMSVCFGLALVVIGLPGGILWFTGRKTAPQISTM